MQVFVHVLSHLATIKDETLGLAFCYVGGIMPIDLGVPTKNGQNVIFLG